MRNRYNNQFVLMAIIAILVVVLGVFVMNAPDRRTTGQKIGDAIDEMPNGADKAARQLEDRMPAEKLEDAAKDVKEDMKN